MTFTARFLLIFRLYKTGKVQHYVDVCISCISDIICSICLFSGPNTATFKRITAIHRLLRLRGLHNQRFCEADFETEVVRLIAYRRWG